MREKENTQVRSCLVLCTSIFQWGSKFSLNRNNFKKYRKKEKSEKLIIELTGTNNKQLSWKLWKIFLFHQADRAIYNLVWHHNILRFALLLKSRKIINKFPIISINSEIQGLSQPKESIILFLLFCFDLCSIYTFCLCSLFVPTFLFTANTDTTTQR